MYPGLHKTCMRISIEQNIVQTIRNVSSKLTCLLLLAGNNAVITVIVILPFAMLLFGSLNAVHIDVMLIYTNPQPYPHPHNSYEI